MQIDDIKDKQSVQSIIEKLISDKQSIFDKWLEFCSDLSSDNLQPIFQYYLADRKEKMQDYTPVSLAKTCVKLAGIENAKSCYDMCAGSGALTIQAWNINKDCEFICEEFDETVIPFLIFNLSIRNTNATVIHGDIINEKRFTAYRLKRGEKYSEIEIIAPPEDIIKTDICISNPPYNMKWEQDCILMFDTRFCGYGLPPKANANYVFILTALRNSQKSCLILPCSVLAGDTLQDEVEIRKNIIHENKIESIVLCPDNMFEATSISTCLFCLDNNKTTATTEFIDMRKQYNEEKRLQNGQFGGKSHTNRVYEKTIKTFSDEHIDNILTAVSERKNQSEISKCAGIEDIKNNNYILSSARYIEFIEQEIKHRTYTDILNDINRVRTEKNNCKLIINETLAKKIGFDVDLYKTDSVDDSGLSDLMTKLAGGKIVKSDYITFTKNKNEFTFKNNNSEFVSTILMSIMSMWKQHCMYLNNQENIYLAEMRDALLPDLMSGKIEDI